jgi:hypothetical protein
MPKSANYTMDTAVVCKDVITRMDIFDSDEG